MAKYSIEDTTLTALGDAVRDKTGKLTRPIYENTDVFTVEVPLTMSVNHNFPVSGVRSVVIRIMEENFAGPTYYLVNLNTNTETKISFNNGASPDIVKEATLTTLDKDCEYSLQVVNMWKDGYVATIKLIYYDANNKLIQVPIYIKNTMTPSQMIEEIENIKEYVEPPVIQTLEIINNGIYTAPEGIGGYNPITVNVPQDGGPTAEELTITGSCEYRFAYDGWNWVINKYGYKITTKDIGNSHYMFTNCSLEEIPFELNYNTGKSFHDISYMFYKCNNLLEVPKFNKCVPYTTDYMFYECKNLRYLPEDIEEWFDWSYIEKQTSTLYGKRPHTFNGCSSLRSIPMGFLNHGNPKAGYSGSIYYSTFAYCISLDEVVDLPIQHTQASWTSNAFYYTFQNCFRLKNMTFATQADGSPYVINTWSKQTIDLSSGVGTAGSSSNIPSYNNGITADKEVFNDSTYQKYKNDPDWFTKNAAYSRYNHDSAVATINSLPDLSGGAGNNTIKFKGAAGSATDGGAINTLTAEEIAVAAAKGWTVSLV